MVDPRDEYRRTGLRVDFGELHYDPEGMYLYRGEPFTGVAFEDEERPDTFDEEAFVAGLHQGFSRIVWKTGVVKEEEWNLAGFTHGIRRVFREDGTVASAAGVEYGWRIWEVSVAPDGSVSERPPREIPDFNRRTYYEPRKARWNLPIPGASAALDLGRH